MPRCPKCKCEYDQGYKTCYNCAIDLVDELVQIEDSSCTEYDREVYLVSVSNNIEAEIVEDLLTSNKIPVLKKYRETGAYLNIYMGGTNFGVDIYVPSKLMTKAKEILKDNYEVETENSQNNSHEENITESNDRYNKKRRFLTWILILIFVPGALGFIIKTFIVLIKWIMYYRWTW